MACVSAWSRVGHILRPDLIRCPCCGKPVQRPSAELLALLLGLTPTQSAILRAVMKGRGESVPTETIQRTIYHDDDSPPDADRQYSTFKEKLCLMRPKLARVGLGIENVARGDGFRLVQVTDEVRDVA